MNTKAISVLFAINCPLMLVPCAGVHTIYSELVILTKIWSGVLPGSVVWSSRLIQVELYIIDHLCILQGHGASSYWFLHLCERGRYFLYTSLLG